MIRHFIFTAVLMSFAASLFAQQLPTASVASSTYHVHAGSMQEIDGSGNPELIPDATAYRLFFVVASTMPNPRAEEYARQRAHVGKIHLREDDNQQLIPVLNSFRVQYADLIKRYNAIAEAAALKGNVPDNSWVLTQRDALVQNTREQLNRVLTQDGAARLQEHIQREKRGIKIFRPASK